jgi:hypothetical protein
MEAEEEDHEFVVVEITSTLHTPPSNTAIMASSLLSLCISSFNERQEGGWGLELNPTTAKKI